MPIEGVLAEARKKEQAGDLQGALQALEATPQEERTGAWHYARGAMVVRQGKFDEGVAELEQAVQREPEIAEYRSNLGAALLEKVKAGDTSQCTRALEQLELAVQWGATLPEVYSNLSFARLAAGNALGALAAADVGLRLDGEHVASLFNRAAALNALKQYGTCLDTLDELLKVSPGFPPAVQSKASVKQRMSKL